MSEVIDPLDGKGSATCDRNTNDLRDMRLTLAVLAFGAWHRIGPQLREFRVVEDKGLPTPGLCIGRARKGSAPHQNGVPLMTDGEPTETMNLDR